MKGRKEYVEKEAEEVKHPSLLVATFLIVVSPVILAFGADFLIKGASAIAASFGVSERVIGVTVVAFGTSVPELVASLVAAFRKEMDISVGNIIGSNLFNICSVIGLTAIISPIPVNYPSFVPDFRYMTLFAVLLPLLIIPFRKSLVSLQSGTFKPSEMLVGGRLGRMGGLLLVAVYLYFILRLFF